MDQKIKKFLHCLTIIFALPLLQTMHPTPAAAGGYDDALKGVKGVKAVYDVSLGSAKVANVVFWAVRNSYEDKSVQDLPEKPKVAVVFRGPAVGLLTGDGSNFSEEDRGEVEKFHGMLRQLKKDGVKLEVCLYAAKVMGIDPAAIMPEVEGVGNGFISVIGYQAQGYSVVRIP